MKSTIIITSALFVILSFFLACDNDRVSPQGPGDSEASRLIKTSVLQDLISHEISDTVALECIGEYQDYIGEVDSVVSRHHAAFSDPGTKLVYGANVDRVTLFELLNASTAGDSLYVMLGIMKSVSGVDSTGLIFAIESDGIRSKFESLDKRPRSSGGWHFFDFTRPCPDACPDFYN